MPVSRRPRLGRHASAKGHLSQPGLAHGQLLACRRTCNNTRALHEGTREHMQAVILRSGM